VRITVFALVAGSAVAAIICLSKRVQASQPASASRIVLRFDSANQPLAISAQADRRRGVCYWVSSIAQAPLLTLPACGPPVVGETVPSPSLRPRYLTVAAVFSHTSILIFGVTAAQVTHVRISPHSGRSRTVSTSALAPRFGQPVRFYGVEIPPDEVPVVVSGIDRLGRRLELHYLSPPIQ
jgi:hypothetical protein